MTTRALREQLLALPMTEKLSLVQDLWDSIAEDQQSLRLSAEHERILDQRLAAHEGHPKDMVSWEDAKKEARRQIAEQAKKRKK